MKSSKFNDTNRSKESASRQLDSDGSGSVVSLPSSSSGDGKFPPNHHSEGVGRTIITVDSVEEITAQKGAGSRFKDGSTPTHHKLGKLQKKLQTLPTQDTLDEIIYTMKNQNGLKDSSAAGMSLHNNSATGGKGYQSVPSYTGSLAWNSTSPLQTSGNEKVSESQTRQLKDITAQFESEIEKIHEQLTSIGNSLLALQDALPVKMLEAANHKLEARCNVLEQVCEQMKNKSVRLEQSNQELDGNCGQLRQINQNLEVRCLYLEQVSQANESERAQLHKNIRDLEDKVLELAASNDKAIGACRQLEELNQKCETKIQTMEESKNLLESRYKSCASENQKLENQIGQCQKTLDQYKKKCRDFEDAFVSSKQEKENLVMKLEFSNKAHIQIKEKYEELKSMCAPKDELISRLENEMRELSAFVKKTIKERTEAEGKSKRDEELLQRMLIEYDILARDYQEAQESQKMIYDKLELTQKEMTNLRETISKLASRKTIVEEASKEINVNKQQNSHVEQPHGKNKPSTVRKTWEQLTPIKKREPQRQNMTTSSTRPETGRDQVLFGADSYADSPPVHSSTPRKQDLSSSGSKPSTTPKRHQVKSVATKDCAEPGNSVLPGGMMVKKTNLLTMFDVVFEDTKSGEEMFRSHTGRTCRVYNDPVQTEANFIASGSEVAGGLGDSTFGTCRNTRMLAVEEYDSDVSEPRKAKSKQSIMSNVAEKDIGGVTSQAVNKDSTEENENKMYLMEKRFSNLTEERKKLESTLSRRTQQSEEDKAYLENRLDEVARELALVRTQLRRQH